MEKGEKGETGEKGEKGDKGDSFFKLTENNALTVESIRNAPCEKLSALYYNTSSKEISYDGSIPSYSDLVKTVQRLEQEVEKLKSQ